MKKITFLLVVAFTLYCCGNDSKETKGSDHKANSSTSSSETSEVSENEIDHTSKDDTNSDLNNLHNKLYISYIIDS